MRYDAYKITTVKYYKAGKDASQIYFGGSPLINADANGIFISGRDLIINPELRLDGVAIGLDFLKSTIKVGNISAMTLSNFMSSVISDPTSNLTASSNDHYTDTSFELSIVATNTSNAVSTTTISLHLVGIKETSSYTSDSSINITVIRNGAYISRVDVYYAQSSSNSVAPTSGWNTTAPTWVNGEFMWTKTLVVFSDGTSKYSNAVCLPSGKGIASITEQYYKSSSSTSQIGGSWSDTAPQWENGYYIWTRSYIIYTDGSSVYTNPINATGEKGDPGTDGEPGKDGNPGKDGVDGKDADFHKIEVLGSNAYTGISSTIEGPLPYVLVDGNDILTKKTRGINMVVLNSATLAPVIQVNYDTYSDVSGNEDLIIDNINIYSTDEYIIIFATYDAAVISDAIANVIHDKLGGQRISFGDESSGTARRSYVFVGQHNNPSQVAFEAINSTYDISDNTATVTATVSNGKLLSFYRSSDPVPYPDGVWDSTKEYKITSNTAPMVFRPDSDNGNYYILISSTSVNQVPEDNPTVWRHLEEYGAVYARILFADFAALGSAIFKGDFMFSQQGVTTTNNNTYKNFDALDPDNPSKFVPNFYINLLQGYFKSQNADIRGTITERFSFVERGTLNIVNFNTINNIAVNRGIDHVPAVVVLPMYEAYAGGNFNTPAYTKGGTNISIQNSYNINMKNWKEAASLLNGSGKDSLRYQLAASSVFIVSDPRIIAYNNYTGSVPTIYPNGSGNANDSVEYRKGRMFCNGKSARIAMILPGQMLRLQSAIEIKDGVSYLVWYVVNASEYTSINKGLQIVGANSMFGSDVPGTLSFYATNTYSNWGESSDHDTDFLIAPKELDAEIIPGYDSEEPSIVLDCSTQESDATFYIDT